MTLTADQELRRELLLFSLSKQTDLRTAISIAAQMEQFVLRGCTQIEEAAGRAIAAVKSNGAGPTDRIETERHNASDGLHYREPNGTAVSPTPPGGITSSARPVADTRDASGESKKRRWSKGDDERLRRLWHSDHPLEDIAEAMGRTTPSLYSRARALGMPKRGPVVDKREPARSNGNGREPTSAGEDDPSGDTGRQAGPVTSKTRPVEIEIRRHAGNEERSSAVTSVLGGGKQPKRNGSPRGRFSQSAPLDTSVEPAIHFLRSRDYSVVRIEDGLFKLDGRRVLNADELREKANQVRQSLRKPFASQSAGPAG